MSWSKMGDVPNPIFDVNGDPYSGAVLKAYLPGTTTSTSIATDSAGTSPQASITANANGIWEVSGNEIVPHIDRKHKWGIFANATDAAANTPFYMGPFDNIKQTLESGGGRSYLTLDEAIADAANLAIGEVIYVVERATGIGGAASWQVIASTTNNTYNIVDTPLNTDISLQLIEGDTLTFEEVGSVGAVDEAALIANVFSRAQGKRIKGLNGKTYVSSTVQTMLASTELDLGGATLKFTGTAGVKDLEPANGCEIWNGTMEEAGSAHSGSGEAHCPVSVGNFQSGVGVSNVSIHDLTVISNKPDGVLIGIWGGSNNIEVYNIIAPTSSTVNSVVECHWGGQAADDAVQHPYDIRIDNIKCNGMTSTTVGGAMIFLSSVYNVAVSNIRGNNVIRGVVVSAGDWGDDYSIASQKGLIGKNITIDNVLIDDCFKIGLQVDGYSQYALTDHDTITGDTTVASPNITNVSSTSKLFVGRVINVTGAGEFQIRGISGTTVVVDRDVGFLLTGAAIDEGSWSMEVKVSNSAFRCDGSATVVGPMTIQATSGAYFENCEFSGGLTNGVNFLDWVHNCTWFGGHIHDNQNNGVDENRSGKSNNNTFDRVKFTKNNLAAGTGRTDSCSVFFTSSNNKAINCDFGQYAQETAYIHVSVSTTARNTEVTDNKFLGAVSGGFALRNGAAGTTEDFDTRTLFKDNIIESTVTPLYKVSGGTPPLSRVWLNQVANIQNVEWHFTGAPGTKTHNKGDRVIQAEPAVGSPVGWMCTVTGTPGTWVALANL